MKKVLIIALCLMIVVFSFASCKKTVSSGTTETTKTKSTQEASTMNYEGKDTSKLIDMDGITAPGKEEISEQYQTRDPKTGDKVAIIHTTYGDISFRLLDEVAPLAVANFIALAQAGRFDTTIFHRVINNFMIQCGDYTNFNGTGGGSAFGEEFKNECNDKIKNIEGSVAMANRGPDTNGSQFYINQVDNDYLNGSYTVFGQVYDGLEVVDDIAHVETDSQDKPTTDVVIETIEILDYKE